MDIKPKLENANIGFHYTVTDEQIKAHQQKSVEEIYNDFITKVGEGRKMSADEVDSVGQGRVWSGVDAKKIGLVDELGGIEVAIALAAKKLVVALRILVFIKSGVAGKSKFTPASATFK